jgi:hypothetical protein
MSPDGRDVPATVITGRAFGLDLEIAFPCAGLTTVDRASHHPVRIERTTQRVLRSGWPSGSTRLRRYITPDAAEFLTVDQQDDAGFLFRFNRNGWFRIAPDGDLVQCAPGRVREGCWQRLLVNQILPFVCILRGLEPLHSSAVCINGGAIAFVGESGAGKSTLALSLVLRGGTLITDDVLIATTDGNGSALAHPAFGLMNVRFETLKRLGDDVMARLGPPVDEDVEGVRVPIDVASEPVPLRAMCFVTPSDDAAAPIVERVDPWDPRLLLGASFNLLLDTPGRLVRQLESAASLSRAVPALRITRPREFDPNRLLDAVLTELEGVAV